MADYTTTALFGSQGNQAFMPANMLNPGMAQGETDWGAVLTNGIRGATEGALAGLVAEKYASGQLAYPPGAYAQQGGGNMMPLLVIGAIAYLVLKG
jgi:hypothetical protein